MALEVYINQGAKRLRCGYTTGSCATLASKAAAKSLLTKTTIKEASIMTPKGIPVKVDILEMTQEGNSVRCAVRKDAGDDIDATAGMLIYATVECIETGIVIDGGTGIGRITQKGLAFPIGTAAINKTPRKMIKDALTALAKDYDYTGGFKVVIDAPEGIAVAKRTFNAKLGIEGGISIIGTTGIVEPMSLKALIATIELEMKIAAAKGQKQLVLTPGNLGEVFIQEQMHLEGQKVVQFSNFIGDSLDFGSVFGYDEILIVSHIGKAVKLAGGIMNTHSRYADCRVEIFSAYAALEGASQSVIEKIMVSKTTDAVIEILKEANLLEGTLQRIIRSAQEHLEYRVADKYKVGIVMYSNAHGLLGMSEPAKEMVEEWGKHE